MEYRNTKTGVVISVDSEISGGNWEPIKKAPSTTIIDDKPIDAPKKTTRLKK